MPEMHAVEIADRHGAAALIEPKRGKITQKFHSREQRGRMIGTTWRNYLYRFSNGQPARLARVVCGMVRG
jgi:hypothetical protein